MRNKMGHILLFIVSTINDGGDVMERKWIFNIIKVIMVLCILLILLLLFLPLYISSHISCKLTDELTDISIENAMVTNYSQEIYGLSSDEYKDFCDNPQSYRLIYIECSPKVDVMFPGFYLYNFSASGEFDNDFASMVVGNKISIINEAADTNHKYVQVPWDGLNFSFLIKIDGHTDEEIIQYVKSGSFIFKAHTAFPFINVSFKIQG